MTIKLNNQLISKAILPDEKLFHLIIESICDYAIFTIDLNGRVATWNAGAERLFGYSKTEIINQPSSIIFTAEDTRAGIPELELKLAARDGHAADVRWHARRDKSLFWANGMVMPLSDDNGKLRGYVKVAQDFTHVKATAEEREKLLDSLETERNGLAAILQQIPAGVIVVEAPSERVIHSNRRAAQILGHQPEQNSSIVEKSQYGAVHPDGTFFRAEEYPSHRAAVLGETISDQEMVYQRGDGRRVYLRVNAAPVRDAQGQIASAVLAFHDVTDRKNEEERMAHAAFHDALTKLPNRRLLNHHLQRAIAHTRRNPDSNFAVMFLDLDRFKVINDSLGHQIGDKLLINVAYKIKGLLRSEDVIARLGGDEFVILLTDVRGAADAKFVADRIHEQLRQPFTLDEHTVFTSTSIGIALSNNRYNQPEEILRDADTAMYRAKTSKAKFEIFDPKMHERMMTLLRLENDLRGALERGEFAVFYQPVLSVADNRIVGFEALARWQHPIRGLIAPSEFIPLAEETNLIKPIGSWVLGEACRQMREWQTQFPAHANLTVSVNISSQQFAQSNFANEVGRILQQTKFAPATLKLEITETSLMEQADTASNVIEQLKELGIKLYIDDFGTGYSSLSRLHSFPVDVLKIDRSFVERLNPPHEDAAIVRAIIQLAHTLKMEVMAEGVESAAQLALLRELGCEYWQGFYYSEPLAAHHAAELLRTL